ncbi:uncharacterized protein AB675_4011 [Cyphellophora attinorum]|uniref:Zn(2)-C6 fungal-type domain-containing protein n=1 Tax=Cyphellophora attinorum TaxID=1664694 RepID=A0A0N0NK10_9EURO|nr:uncharacterized protein AB675_4011 [Phialophora attinorum]KPI37508.1 hypothetical protein AB675_4011 [Phialophora attinorum]
MFFITPQKEHLVYASETGHEHGPSKKRRHQHYQPEPPSTQDVASGYYPRRIPKACDRCRLKKVKCSGGKLCKRCELDGVVCITTLNSEVEQGPVEARQYHLVESQRDRLLQIISEILHGKDEIEVARLRELLSNMGLSLKNLPLSSTTTNATTQPVVLAPAALDQISGPAWLGLWDQLQDNEPLGQCSDFSNSYPATQPGRSAVADVPFDSEALPETNTFNFDELVEWDSVLLLDSAANQP